MPDWTAPSRNPDCVLAGGWTAWSDYSSCSAACSRARTRSCSNPTPLNSKQCEGETSEEKSVRSSRTKLDFEFLSQFLHW